MMVANGCEVDVRTSAAQPPGNAVLNGAHYRFERGPLIAGQPDPARLEAMAPAALARVGAVRDDARPRVSVQVGGYVNADYRDLWGEPSNARVALGLVPAGHCVALVADERQGLRAPRPGPAPPPDRRG